MVAVANRSRRFMLLRLDCSDTEALSTLYWTLDLLPLQSIASSPIIGINLINHSSDILHHKSDSPEIK